MKHWREFFGSEDLMPVEEVERRYPNIRRAVRDCVFISHAGSDGPELRKLLTNALLGEGYRAFQYSSRDRGRTHYKQVVRLAMEHCACAVVACSALSVGHDWVYAEVDWLLAHRRPVQLLSLDRTNPRKVHPDLAWWPRQTRGIREYDRKRTKLLLRALDRMNIRRGPEETFDPM